MDNTTKGAIIDKSVIYDVKKYPNNNEFVLDKNKYLSLKKLANNKNMYGFLIKDAVKFDNAVPCLVKMGFFNVHES